jgi:hypothetical protein
MKFRDFDINIVLTEDMDESSHGEEDDHLEEESEENDIIHPAVGMGFEFSDDVFYFYNNYAKNDFGAVRRTNHHKDGVCYRSLF